MKPSRSFASDNNAGVHPEVLKSLAAVNEGHVVGYGDDPYTASAESLFRRHFGDDVAERGHPVAKGHRPIFAPGSSGPLPRLGALPRM